MSASFCPDELPESSAFLRRQLGLVEGRDPREVLAETPELLEALVDGHPSEMFACQAVVGKWTPAEILGHLADGEWIFGFRMRVLFGEDQPALSPVDQDGWVRQQRHREREPRELTAAFRALRGLNLLFWQDVGSDRMDRAAVHPEAGVPYSLGLLLRLQAGHDLVHLQQLVETLDLLAATRADR